MFTTEVQAVQRRSRITATVHVGKLPLVILAAACLNMSDQTIISNEANTK
jgi:hypothetical protein